MKEERIGYNSKNARISALHMHVYLILDRPKESSKTPRLEKPPETKKFLLFPLPQSPPSLKNSVAMQLNQEPITVITASIACLPRFVRPQSFFMTSPLYPDLYDHPLSLALNHRH
jgi:hypothetical protein